jgi:hypothetical protein
MSSYRAELGGIVAALYVIHRICDYYSITTGQATLYCDNKGAINNSFQSITPGISPFLSPSYDLLLLAKQLVTSIPITIVGQWVKGHYTGNNRKIQHDLNDMADELAGDHLTSQDRHNGTNTSIIPYPGYKIRLLKDNKVISSKYFTTISQGRHERHLQEYILRRTKWSWGELNKIDWDSHEKAFKHLTRHQQIITAKLIHNLVNTNRQNFLYYQTSPLCPGCRQVEETMEHVLLCSWHQTRSFRDQQLSIMEKQLSQSHTPPPVTRAIMNGFKDWIDPPSGRSRAPTYGSLHGPDVLLTSVYYEQYHQLGWFQMCLGRISKLWSKVVSTYYANTCL